MPEPEIYAESRKESKNLRRIKIQYRNPNIQSGT